MKIILMQVFFFTTATELVLLLRTVLREALNPLYVQKQHALSHVRKTNM
jgi:hypothetical protein